MSVLDAQDEVIKRTPAIKSWKALKKKSGIVRMTFFYNIEPGSGKQVKRGSRKRKDIYIYIEKENENGVAGFAMLV